MNKYFISFNRCWIFFLVLQTLPVIKWTNFVLRPKMSSSSNTRSPTYTCTYIHVCVNIYVSTDYFPVHRLDGGATRLNINVKSWAGSSIFQPSPCPSRRRPWSSRRNTLGSDKWLLNKTINCLLWISPCYIFDIYFDTSFSYFTCPSII